MNFIDDKEVNKIDDRVLVIQKYVRKTNICGGEVADIVDDKKDLTQYYLEIFPDNELIYVRSDQKIYKVYSREIAVYKSDLPKLREREEKERQQLRKKQKRKGGKIVGS